MGKQAEDKNVEKVGKAAFPDKVKLGKAVLPAKSFRYAIYALVAIVVVLSVAAIVSQSMVNPMNALNRKQRETVYGFRKKFLKDYGEAAENLRKGGVDYAWEQLPVDTKIEGNEYVLKEATLENPAFSDSIQGGLIKRELAVSYRGWAEEPTATRDETRERLQRADGLFTDVVSRMEPADLMYFQVVLAQARVKLDLGMFADGPSEKKKIYREAADYIDEQLGVETNRKIAEEYRLRILRGIALARLYELGGREDDSLREAAIDALETGAGALPTTSVERDLANDLVRRLEADQTIVLAGDIDQALDTQDGRMILSLPEPPVLEKSIEAVSPAALSPLPEPPVNKTVQPGESAGE